MSSTLPPYALARDAVLNDLNDDSIKWRYGLPNYQKAHALFEKYKSTSHSPGTLESIVQNIVKNWEIEVSHKLDPEQWSTVDLGHYTFSCNGGQKYSGHEMLKQGTYNALIGETAYYSSKSINFEDSHKAFKQTFGDGFAWELIELYSGPPNVTFKWRHFGVMTDSFSCPGLSGLVYRAEATNKMVELYGMCVAKVTDDLKIQDLQVFYDPSQLFTQLTEICPFSPFQKSNVVQPVSAEAQFIKSSVLEEKHHAHHNDE